MRLVILLALTSAALGALELTGSNFEETVISGGKNSFIKFLAPW